MSHMDQINRTMNLLSQALNVAGNSLNTADAKGHIRKAIQKLEIVKSDQNRKDVKKETLHEKWWGTIKSGIGHGNLAGIGNGNLSQKAYSKTLNELDKMIEKEQKVIDNLEQSVQQTTKSEILKD